MALWGVGMFLANCASALVIPPSVPWEWAFLVMLTSVPFTVIELMKWGARSLPAR